MGTRFVLALFVFGLGLLGCGKVTQIAKSGDDAKTFDLTYELPVQPTRNIRLITKNTPAYPINNIFTPLDQRVFVQVVGVKDRKGSVVTEELSWGRAVLAKDVVESLKVYEAAPTGNKPIDPQLKSEAFRKDGLPMTSSDYEWTLLNYDNPGNSWQGDSKKIPLGYDGYFVTVYSTQSKYRMMHISQTDEGVHIAGEISQYDTFLAVLRLLDIRQSKTGLKGALSTAEISELFTLAFFESLNYPFPANKYKDFVFSKPVFTFNRALEKHLLIIANLVRSREFDEAESYLNEVPKNTFKKESKKLLINELDYLKEFYKDESAMLGVFSTRLRV